MMFIILGIIFLGYICHPTIMYYIHKANADSLPDLSNDFVGREEHLSEIIDLIDFKKSDLKIVNIFGSPGFGKSTLAIHAGHKMLERGVTVHYVDLSKCSKDRVRLCIAQKVIESSTGEYENVDFKKFLRWVRGKFFYNLIILDNCDESLRMQKEELQSTIEKIVYGSKVFRILMTSREVTIHTNSFEQFRLHELSTEAACELLQLKLPTHMTITSLEKKELAKETGNVPLALQIVGSLFRLPDLVSPAQIIKELKENSILALSPKQLPEDRQINASFSLSYKYLSVKERRIGQVLSNFRGSFSIDATVTILSSFIFLNKSIAEREECVQGVLSLLVQRSLLELDGHHRYHFHPLIRNYFLEKQRLSDVNKEKNFTVAFQRYFFHLLKNISDFYNDSQSYKRSLTIMDYERDSFLELFEDITMKGCIPFLALQSISHGIDSGLLTSRISYNDLIQLIEFILADANPILIEYLLLYNEHLNKHIEQQVELYLNISNFFMSALFTAEPNLIKRSEEIMRKTEELLKISYYLPSNLTVPYTLLVYHLIDLHKKVNSSEAALAVFYKYKSIVDSMYKKESNDSKTPSYIRILSTASHLLSELGKHNESIEYYSIVIDYSRKAIRDCVSRGCSYKDFGYHHKMAGNHDQALYFYELSLSVDDYTNIPLQKLHSLFYLHELYILVGETSAASEILKQAESLLPEIVKLPHFLLFKDMDNLNSFIVRLHKYGTADAANMLEGCAISVILTMGAEINVGVLYPKQAYLIVKTLYVQRNYTESVKLGTYALRAYTEQEDGVKLKRHNEHSVKLLVVTGLAKLCYGNISQGWSNIEHAFNSINKVKKVDLSEEYSTCCFYLIPRLRYLGVCYQQHLTDLMHSFLKGLVYVIFVQPLEGVSAPSNHTHVSKSERRDTSSSIKEETAREMYPQLSNFKLSTSSKDIVQRDTFLKQVKIIISRTFSGAHFSFLAQDKLAKIYSYFDDRLHRMWPYIKALSDDIKVFFQQIQYPVFHFLINLVSIFARITLFISCVCLFIDISSEVTVGVLNMYFTVIQSSHLIFYLLSSAFSFFFISLIVLANRYFVVHYAIRIAEFCISICLFLRKACFQFLCSQNFVGYKKLKNTLIYSNSYYCSSIFFFSCFLLSFFTVAACSFFVVFAFIVYLFSL